MQKINLAVTAIDTVSPPTVNNLVLAASAALVAVTVLASTPIPAGTFPAEFQLESLQPANGGDGTLGAIINGIVAGDRSGDAVGAGDINGDGLDDLIIGAPMASPGGDFRAGETYVVFGDSEGLGAEFELSSLKAANGGDGTAGFVLIGRDPGDASGMRLSDGVDVNGDGFDDLIIGADLADPDSVIDGGEIYVIYGSDGAFAPEIELSSLLAVNGGDGSAGFVIKGVDSGDFAGVIGLGGDFNNDMIDDLLIGAKNADPSGRGNAGETYIVFGRDTGFDAEFALSSLEPANGGDGTLGSILAGVSALDQSGTAVDNAGDVNDDGIDDIIIGAPEADADGLAFAGEAYVVFGRSTFPAVIELSTLATGDGSAGFVIYGEGGNSLTGRAVSGAGDVNNDGIDDLVVGAGLAAGGAGRAYVVFGRDTGFAATLPLLSLNTLNGGDGSAGFIAEGTVAGDAAGRVVSELGDINNDGIDDVAIGAYSASPGGLPAAGSTFAIYGRNTGFPAELPLSSLRFANGGDGSMGFVINGIDALDASGIGISPAGDVNGDNIDDVIIGAGGGDPGGSSSAGESYVIYGQQSPAEPDTDGDGVADSGDNCLTVANPDQVDTNGDNIGNLCDADVTGPGGSEDCVVNFLDLNAMKLVFFTNSSSPSYDPDIDINSDGNINFADLNVMKAYFFSAPGPSALGCN